MKRLNRKGFTLIELLAVIVILAVVMVVTIPSVLNAMGSARTKQAVNAIHAIEEYVQKNYDLCKSNIAGDLGVNYDSSIFTNTTSCALKTDGTIITAAGYKTADIASITDNATSVSETEKYKISAATVGGKFNGVTGAEDGITFTSR